MKYAVVMQHSETDCGAACLGTIAQHYGTRLSLNRLRELVGTGQQGTTLLGLQRGAMALGFNARSVKASPAILQRLAEAPLPAILHWQGYHWVVLYGMHKQTYVIADPAMGIRYLSEQELQEQWTDWIMLLLEPDLARLMQEGEPPGTWRKFWHRLQATRSLLIEVVVLNLWLGLLSIATPFLIQWLTDDVLVRGDQGLLNSLAIAVMLLTLLGSGLGWVQSMLTAYFAQRLELGLVLEFGRAILHLPQTYYETHRSGEMVSRLQDIQELNQLATQVLVSLPSQGFIALVSFGVMVGLSGKLTLLAGAIALLMTLSTVAFLPTLQQQTRRVLALDAENQGVLVETFKGALTLKSTTATSQLWGEFQSRFGRLARLSFRTTQIGIVNTVFSGLVAGVGSIVLLWFGSTLVIQRELSIGQLLAFTSLNANFTGLISTVIRFADEFALVQASVQRLTEVIDHPSEIKKDAGKPFVALSPVAEVCCEGVAFHYPGQVDLLRSFSLKLPGGQVVALIGRSGCGKSTLAKLWAGLYPLQEGNIRIGAYNLPDLAIDCVRQQIVLVPQEAHFWSRSILENFRLGQPHADFEAIVAVCQKVGADDFISRLPDRYQTVLGEFGANLSGGQRQRLAIARALLANPAILILDESTASLDPVSEAMILDQILRDRLGKTTILISHRSQVIRQANWIVLLERGELVLQGATQDLLTQPGPHQEFLQG